MLSSFGLLGLLRDKLESDTKLKERQGEYFRMKGLAELEQANALRTQAKSMLEKAPAEVEKLRAEAFSTKRLAQTPTELGLFTKKDDEDDIFKKLDKIGVKVK